MADSASRGEKRKYLDFLGIVATSFAGKEATGWQTRKTMQDDEGRSSGTLQAAFEAFHKHDVDEDHLISSAELLSVLQEAGLKVGPVCCLVCLFHLFHFLKNPPTCGPNYALLVM